MKRNSSTLIGVIVAAVIVAGVWLVLHRSSGSSNHQGLNAGLNPSVLADHKPRLMVNGKITATVLTDGAVVAHLPKTAAGTCGSRAGYTAAFSPAPGETAPNITFVVDPKTCVLTVRIVTPTPSVTPPLLPTSTTQAP